MDKKLKSKWVKALRSGAYRQTSGALYRRNEDAYCCLGVLCSVAGAKATDLIGLGYPEDTSKFTHLVPHSVAKELAKMNDLRGGGVPFEIIAGLIHEAL